MDEMQTITFGSYPQSRVNDEELVAALTEQAGGKPAEGGLWRKTFYWKGHRKEPSRIWLVDVERDGERYRGVSFEYYRSHFHDYGKNYIQKVNGYLAGNVYWFRYEPIVWQVLSDKDGVLTLLSEKVLDDMEYNDRSCLEDPTAKNAEVPCLPFQKSLLRLWLNDDFYRTAFDEAERARFVPTICSFVPRKDETLVVTPQEEQNQVFLLTFDEVWAYAEKFVGKEKRLKWTARTSTDYANAQGAWPVFGAAQYWTCESTAGKTSVPCVDYRGSYSSFYHDFDSGVLPAIRIKSL